MLVHIFDRSNLDDIVAIFPATSDRPERQKTRREMLADERYITRTDIVLVNCTNSGKEYALYVRQEGFSGDLFVLDMLSVDEYERVMRIAERMRMNAEQYAPAAKYLEG